jgi:DNA-binding transcriptional MerR regulator
VPAATLKHYMREGLLPRAELRATRNSAYYDPRLAARVRAIKELQTRRFLPLKLIAELLEPPPSAQLRADAEATLRRHLGALEPAIRAGATDAGTVRGRHGERRTRAQVLAALQVTAQELDDLAVAQLVEPQVLDGEVTYGGADLEILEIIDEVRRTGMGDLFPMPILAPYAAAVRTLVRVEIELFRRQVLAGSAMPPRPLDEVAREATRLGERLVVAMRAKLVIPELRNAAGSDPTRR